MTAPKSTRSAVKPPTLLSITKGATITHGGNEYVIVQVVDLNKVLARDRGSDQTVLLKIDTIEPPTTTAGIKDNTPTVDLEGVSKDDWEEAERRLALIKDLLPSTSARPKADYANAAIEGGVSVATVYRWVSNYRHTGLLTSLLPVRRSGGRGKSRISKEVQLIIDDYVNTKHLTSQRPTIAKSAREVRRLCDNAGLKPLPALTTFRRHIEWIDGEVKLTKREGTKVARERYAIHKSPIPDAEWPLAIVMIDHTELPVMVVDDKYRKPINRPWLTLAIDAFSRVCPGIYLSLDPPSAMSAGMCVSHTILPKERWLQRVGCGDIEWPFYGVPDVLHMDNAKEFRGNMLRVAAQEYGMDLHLRKVKVPHYGAYIERMMGTVSEDLKSVGGATFSGPKEKGIYDAEGNACLTLDELETRLTLFFAQYHIDMHRGIGTTPMAKWRQGILGTKTKPGRGLPPRRTDVEKVTIDFMPFEERTIQDYGVVIDQVHYFHDVLRPWANQMDKVHKNQGRKYRFRYDPRDISQLYFFEPNVQRYFAIPFRDNTLPPVSLWELRLARKRAAELGVAAYDERAVFGLINRQREVEASAAAKTKAARRAEQKRVQHGKARKQKAIDMPNVSTPTPTSAPLVIPGYDPEAIKPIEDDV